MQVGTSNSLFMLIKLKFDEVAKSGEQLQLHGGLGQKIDLPLFAELGQTSRDLVDIWSETQESWDVCPNSSKSGFLVFWDSIS